MTANVKLNQRIFEIEGVRRIFIYPNMGDGGCGTGAALYHSWPGGIRPTISDAYFGPDYTEQAMAEALDAEGLARRKPEHLAREVARLIHQGKVVARFDGRMEYGPRGPWQSIDPVSRPGTGSEPVAKQATRPHRVYAFCSGHPV